VTRPPGAVWRSGLWNSAEAAWEDCPIDDAGQLHGVATYWRLDGTLLARTEFFHGVEHGLCERFHESGEVSQRGHFVDGERDGQHDSFRSISLTTERAVEGKHDGIWRCENDYADGVVVRFTRYFDRDGRRVDQDGRPHPERPASVPATAILQHGAWIDGRVERGRWHGPFRRWSPTGILIEEGSYRRGERSGAFTRWTRHGMLVERGVYVGGQIKDHWIGKPTHLPASAIASTQGELHWLDGEAVRSRWNEEGQLIEQLHYEARELHGPARVWNAEGVLIGRASYTHGRRHGPFERYFSDGELMTSGAYINGVAAGTFVVVRRPDEAPENFPLCNPRIVRAEQTGVALKLFDGYGIECTTDGIPEDLWRARFPARAAWREAVRAHRWTDALMLRAVLDLAAEDDGLRREARAALGRRRDAVVLDFVIRLIRVPGVRERGALIELLATWDAAELAPSTATWVALLDDPDPAVRARATTLLAQLDATSVIGPLRAALARELDAAVRASLHFALGTLGEAVAAGLIASDPLERLGSALGIIAARGAKSPPTTTATLLAALAEPEPVMRRFHTLPWARTTFVAQICEALREAGGAKPRAALEPLMAALATATSRSAPVLVEALLTLGGNFATLDPPRQAVLAAIAGCELAWEQTAVRELLRRRELPGDRDALAELGKPRRKRKRKDA